MPNASDDVGVPTKSGRFEAVSAAPAAELSPGVTASPIVGESMLLSFVTLLPNAEAPMHSHVEEQLVIVLDGEMQFTIGDETKTIRPGDVAIAPPWVRHGGQAGATGCRIVDIFNPPRAGLLELLQQHGASVSSDRVHTPSARQE